MIDQGQGSAIGSYVGSSKELIVLAVLGSLFLIKWSSNRAGSLLYGLLERPVTRRSGPMNKSWMKSHSEADYSLRGQG